MTHKSLVACIALLAALAVDACIFRSYLHKLCCISSAVQLSEDALQYAARESTIAAGNVYGARPLRRWLEQNVITDMSRMIVAGEQTGKGGLCCVCLGKVNAWAVEHNAGHFRSCVGKVTAPCLYCRM